MKSEQNIRAMHDIIRQTQLRFSGYYTRTLSKENLAIQHFTLMFFIIVEGPMKMSTMAKKLSLTNPAITNLVDRLENEQLISRCQCPEDRRATLLDITDKGRTFVIKTQAPCFNVLAQTFATFNEHEQETIKQFYKKMIENFDKEVPYE